MAKHTLYIADGLRLPANLVTESVAILAKRRAGKSTTARRITEQLVQARQQVVVVDPKGDWWGLRYDRTGQHPGLQFIILGGEHGDVPLEPGAASGDIIARLVVEERVNIILDLSSFRKHEIPPFMTAFMETLYRLKAAERYRTPVMIVIDEADVIAPQKQSREGQAEMISAADDLVRRGGQRGIGVMMITQRSAVLNKDLLTQIGVLIVLRTVAPQDRKAISTWIDVHGSEEFRTTVLESLPTLKTGEAWIWAPGWPTGEGIFARHQILLPETFDSSFTPDATKRTRRLANPASIDLDALSTRMADTIAHVKDNDPRELKSTITAHKATIRDLEDKLKRANAAQPAPPVKAKKPRGLTRRDLAKAAKLLASSRGIVKIGRAWVAAGEGLVQTLERIAKNGQQPDLQTADGARAYSAPAAAAAFGVKTSPTSKLPPGEHAILKSAAQHGAAGVSRGTITLMTGFKKSSRDAYLLRLKGKGLISIFDDKVFVTSQGLTEVGPFDPLPTGTAAIAYWRTAPDLPPGEREIFCLIADHNLSGPASVARLTIQEQTGKKKSSTDAYILRLVRRGLVVTNRDGVTLSPHFAA